MQISNMYGYSLLFLLLFSCSNKNSHEEWTAYAPRSADSLSKANSKTIQIQPGAEDYKAYLPLLKQVKVGLVVNQTSLVGETHLVDFLIEKKVDIQTIFAPEHGFRGEADAGQKIETTVDTKTQLPIISLYGKTKKPSAQNLKDLDVVVFDIQDVGIRFYTYISTLHYVMEACAENNISLIVLDRPNPNGHYIDGPVMEDKFKSFVGMHNVPIVYGMTIGEYAKMINGEAWLEGGVKADLKVIACKNYNHQSKYDLPIKPSPNLPNRRSILLYPSLCFFEPTSFSIGRGTNYPFQVLGHPKWVSHDFSFTPISRPGASNPKHLNKTCGGHHYNFDLEVLEKRKTINLSFLREAFISSQEQDFEFYTSTSFFDKLVGNDHLRKQLAGRLSSEEIRASWQKDLTAFKQIRKKYLMYP